MKLHEDSFPKCWDIGKTVKLWENGHSIFVIVRSRWCLEVHSPMTSATCSWPWTCSVAWWSKGTVKVVSRVKGVLKHGLGVSHTSSPVTVRWLDSISIFHKRRMRSVFFGFPPPRRATCEFWGIKSFMQQPVSLVMVHCDSLYECQNGKESAALCFFGG